MGSEVKREENRGVECGYLYGCFTFALTVVGHIFTL